MPVLRDFPGSFGRHAAVTSAPLPAPAQAASESSDSLGLGSRASFRESIDLLELDLNAMIRAVVEAADDVRKGSRLSSETLGAIRRRTEHLATESRNAKQNTQALAQ